MCNTLILQICTRWKLLFHFFSTHSLHVFRMSDEDENNSTAQPVNSVPVLPTSCKCSLSSLSDMPASRPSPCGSSSSSSLTLPPDSPSCHSPICNSVETIPSYLSLMNASASTPSVNLHSPTPPPRLSPSNSLSQYPPSFTRSYVHPSFSTLVTRVLLVTLVSVFLLILLLFVVLITVIKHCWTFLLSVHFIFLLLLNW